MTFEEARDQAVALLGDEKVALVCQPNEPLPYRVGFAVVDEHGEHSMKCPCCDEYTHFRVVALGRGESWEAALGEVIRRKSLAGNGVLNGEVPFRTGEI